MPDRDKISWPTLEEYDERSLVATSILCQECGICCDGTLFVHITIDRDEVERIQSLNVPLKDLSNGKKRFDQPCQFFVGSKCACHADKPSRCNEFFCKLAEKVMTGEAKLEEARKTTRLVRRQRAWLQEGTEQRNPPKKKNRSFRSFLDAYYSDMDKRLRNEPVSAADREYIERIFVYLKLINRHFLSTSLLSKYASLLQRLPFTEVADH